MFGKRLFGSGCGCGCADYVQSRRLICQIPGHAGVTPTCSDQNNAIAWANAHFNSLAGCGFVPNPSAWEYDCEVVFDNVTDTAPNPAETIPCNGGHHFPNDGSVWVTESASRTGTNPGDGSFVDLAAVLLPYSTAYLVASWCQGHSTAFHQKSCIASGVPTDMGFVYFLPAPLVQICEDVTCDDSSGPGEPTYGLVPNSGTSGDPGMYAFGGDWSNVLADIAAHPTLYQPGYGTPSACLSPDPFYGSSPP